MSHDTFVHSLDLTDDLNQESRNAAIDTVFDVRVASVVSGNVTHWDQFIRFYRDDKLLLETCTIESHCLRTFTRPYR